MKAQLRDQVRDYLVGLNGLASHLPYGFWAAPADVLTIVEMVFRRNYAP